MRHLCAICQRAPRGFGFCLPRTQRKGWENCSTSPEQRKASYHRFCSKRCQDIFYDIYLHKFKQNRSETLTNEHLMENFMNNNYEAIAKEAVLTPLAMVVTEIGMDKGVGHYSKEEIKRVIDTVLKSYHQKLEDLCKDDIPF